MIVQMAADTNAESMATVTRPKLSYFVFWLRRRPVIRPTAIPATVQKQGAVPSRQVISAVIEPTIMPAAGPRITETIIVPTESPHIGRFKNAQMNKPKIFIIRPAKILYRKKLTLFCFLRLFLFPIKLPPKNDISTAIITFLPYSYQLFCYMGIVNSSLNYREL